MAIAFFTMNVPTSIGENEKCLDKILTAGFLEILTTTCASFVCAHIEMKYIPADFSTTSLCVHQYFTGA
jgi:hypothetical protein